MSGPRDIDVETYAALAAALAEGERPRAAVLGEHGLDEASWGAVDRDFQDRMSRALDEDSDGVPEIIARYAEAFERARRALRQDRAILSIERFGDATREIRRLGDPMAALGALGISLADFLRANEHWTRRMLVDPALLQRFRARLGG